MNFIDKIYKNNHIPIFVGGTGLYVDSILYDFKFTEAEKSCDLRKLITEFYEKNGSDLLYDLLLYLDYTSKEKIHNLMENYKEKITLRELLERLKFVYVLIKDFQSSVMILKMMD